MNNYLLFVLGLLDNKTLTCHPRGVHTYTFRQIPSLQKWLQLCPSTCTYTCSHLSPLDLHLQPHVIPAPMPAALSQSLYKLQSQHLPCGPAVANTFPRALHLQLLSSLWPCRPNANCNLPCCPADLTPARVSPAALQLFAKHHWHQLQSSLRPCNSTMPTGHQ